jgi:hypothetical protein
VDDKRVVKWVSMSIEDWEALVESTKRWAYDACRSDVDTDHPEGVRVLDKPFNELCAQAIASGPQDEALEILKEVALEWYEASVADREAQVRLIGAITRFGMATHRSWYGCLGD